VNRFQFRCGAEHRRALVADPASPLNGIDYLEVDAAQRQIAVTFFHNITVALSAINIAIDGGVRVHPSVAAAAAVGAVLTVTVDQIGDFSTYRLRLRVSDIDDDTPAGYDPPLSQIEFSFRVDCDAGLDCSTPATCPRIVGEDPEIDYQARDYASFRRLMLDRLATTTPDWRERNPADVGIALVELFAYLGDQLTYAQDAVAMEAYLATARRRVSVKRHVRLLDYRMHEGINARAWVHFRVKAGNPDVSLPAKTVLLSGGSTGAVVDPGAVGTLIAREQPVVFETMQTVTLREVQNEIRFYSWADFDCRLPKGCTAATLRQDNPLHLAPGDVLVFEEVLDPAQGVAAGADPAHRHAVRLTRADSGRDVEAGVNILRIEWADADALPFPLCLSVTLDGRGFDDVSVARGNIVVADHGRTLAPAPPHPAHPDASGPYRPALEAGPLTYVGPQVDTSLPAAAVLNLDPRSARPSISLQDSSGAQWLARPDLLGSSAFAQEFVVETDDDGFASLRFGDGIHGMQPDPELTFTATQRVGSGSAGNVGRDIISRVVLAGDGIELVRNPLRARGGTDREPVELVKLMAPQAFRTQLRAVTEPDYREVTRRRNDVQDARAQFRWTGSWYTSFVAVDPLGAADLTPAQAASLGSYLELYRMAGWDVEVEAPVEVPLDIELTICVATGYLASHVKAALLMLLGNGTLPDGSRAFFHPDNFTFGQPMFLSALYRAALSVPGVKSLVVDKLERLGRPSSSAVESGELTVGRFEVIRCDSDPNFPDHGRLLVEAV
jgi:hypothetical protein